LAAVVELDPHLCQVLMEVLAAAAEETNRPAAALLQEELVFLVRVMLAVEARVLRMVRFQVLEAVVVQAVLALTHLGLVVEELAVLGEQIFLLGL
jgi:hypothetical protein